LCGKTFRKLLVVTQARPCISNEAERLVQRTLLTVRRTLRKLPLKKKLRGEFTSCTGRKAKKGCVWPLYVGFARFPRKILHPSRELEFMGRTGRKVCTAHKPYAVRSVRPRMAEERIVFELPENPGEAFRFTGREQYETFINSRSRDKTENHAIFSRVR
jgi:hypothetical protein